MSQTRAENEMKMRVPLINDSRAFSLIPRLLREASHLTVVSVFAFSWLGVSA
jgi:hypothetical protein